MYDDFNVDEKKPFGLFKYYSPVQKAAIFLGGIIGIISICCLASFIISLLTVSLTQSSAATPRKTAAIASTEVKAIATASSTSTQTLSRTATNSPTATAQPIATTNPTAANGYTTNANINCIPAQQPQVAQVVSITDGDTIDVSMDGKIYPVRYIGMDTPETHFGTQPFGPEAAAKNRELVMNKQVLLYRDHSETDRFGRLLRYVVVGDIFVNDELVRVGLAKAKRYPPDTACAIEFETTQTNAIAAGIGRWANSSTQQTTNGTVMIISVDKRAEVVTIRNSGSVAVNLQGWTLLSERGSQSCSLGGTIAAGATLQIWSGTGIGYSCGFPSQIWSNTQSDPAVLINASGQIVSRYP